jgi:hypothetical protein
VNRFLPILAALIVGCGGAARVDPPEASAPAGGAPLGSFAAMRMITLPAQFLRSADTSWSARVADPRAFLASVDAALEAAMRDRGLGGMWAFASDLTKTAQRNPMYATDPAQIRVGDAVRVMERRSGSEIPEPVASQLRTLIGFHDARHALVPVEVRFEPVASGGTRAILHVVVLDVRGSRLAWIGDIAGTPATSFSAAVATDLAERFADLVVAR